MVNTKTTKEKQNAKIAVKIGTVLHVLKQKERNEREPHPMPSATNGKL